MTKSISTDSEIHKVTQGPMHHFFGYFGLQPWDSSGRFLLCLEVALHDRPPKADDKAIVGMVDLASSEFIPLAKTSAWNFQQGAMVQWMPKRIDSEIIYNDRRDGRVVSTILNVQTGERRTIPYPVSAVSHDGKTALSLDFGRLQRIRPGYGYAGLDDPFTGQRHPAGDGVRLVDLETCEGEVVVSLSDVLRVYRKSSEIRNQTLCFNHTIYNTDDTRFAFLVQWRSHVIPKWVRVWRLNKLVNVGSIIFAASLDGSDLTWLSGFEGVSHFDWLDSEEILMWARRKGEEHFFLIHGRDGSYRVVGENFLNEDGHCSFSPDRKWVLLDGCPDKNRCTELKLFKWREQRLFLLGRFYSPPLYTGEIRCDLHPRWNRNGAKVCFDSTHDGTRQVYVADVSHITDKQVS